MPNDQSTSLPASRQCSKCDKFFPATQEYFFFEKRKQRLYAQCKVCWRAKGKAFQQANPEKSRNYTKKHRLNNLEAHRQADADRQRIRRVEKADLISTQRKSRYQTKMECAGLIYKPKEIPADYPHEES